MQPKIGMTDLLATDPDAPEFREFVRVMGETLDAKVKAGEMTYTMSLLVALTFAASWLAFCIDDGNQPDESDHALVADLAENMRQQCIDFLKIAGAGLPASFAKN